MCSLLDSELSLCLKKERKEEKHPELDGKKPCFIALYGKLLSLSIWPHLPVSTRIGIGIGYCTTGSPSSPGVFVSLTIKAGKRGTYLSDLADGLKLEVGVTIYVNTKGVAGFFFWVAGKGESQSSVIAPVWPLFFLKSVMELIQESGHFWTLSLPSICNCYSKIVVLGFLLWWKKVSSLILNKPIDKGLQKRHDGVRQEVGLG